MTDPPFDRTEQDEVVEQIENYTEPDDPVSLFAPLIDITEIGTHVSERPKWVVDLYHFVHDGIIDEAHGFPMDGSDDELLDEIEHAVDAILCRVYGHVIVMDQCNIPDHRYCVWCRRGITQIDEGENIASKERRAAEVGDE